MPVMNYRKGTGAETSWIIEETSFHEKYTGKCESIFTQDVYKRQYGNTTSIMLLNIPEQELSYQVYDWKRQMPAIEGMQTKEINKYTWTYDIALPAKKIRNGKTGFEPQFIRDEEYNPEITFSYAIKLTDDQMQMLLEIPRDYYRKRENGIEFKMCIRDRHRSC